MLLHSICTVQYFPCMILGTILAHGTVLEVLELEKTESKQMKKGTIPDTVLQLGDPEPSAQFYDTAIPYSLKYTCIV